MNNDNHKNGDVQLRCLHFQGMALTPAIAGGIPLWIPFTGNHGGVPLQIMSEIEIKPDCQDKGENRCLFDKIESAC